MQISVKFPGIRQIPVGDRDLPPVFWLKMRGFRGSPEKLATNAACNLLIKNELGLCPSFFRIQLVGLILRMQGSFWHHEHMAGDQDHVKGCMQCLHCGFEQDLGTFNFVQLPIGGDRFTFRTCGRCGCFCCQVIKDHRRQRKPEEPS